MNYGFDYSFCGIAVSPDYVFLPALPTVLHYVPNRKGSKKLTRHGRHIGYACYCRPIATNGLEHRYILSELSKFKYNRYFNAKNTVINISINLNHRSPLAQLEICKTDRKGKSIVS